MNKELIIVLERIKTSALNGITISLSKKESQALLKYINSLKQSALKKND